MQTWSCSVSCRIFSYLHTWYPHRGRGKKKKPKHCKRQNGPESSCHTNCFLKTKGQTFFYKLWKANQCHTSRFPVPNALFAKQVYPWDFCSLPGPYTGSLVCPGKDFFLQGNCSYFAWHICVCAGYFSLSEMGLLTKVTVFGPQKMAVLMPKTTFAASRLSYSTQSPLCLWQCFF